ncbi:MAG: type II toxin-antitoxin system PemK/MazF family toxin [bacterium]
MRKAGQIVLFEFPQTDLVAGKSRPALMIAKLPGGYEDWLICMISSQTHQYIDGVDDIILHDSPDFIQSGLKSTSVIRVSRLAVVEEDILLGAIGEISQERLARVKNNLAEWIKSTP